jgi:SAM-dependent methyltransferase
MGELDLVIDGGAREWARIGAAYERGELDDAGWFAATQAVIEPAYLTGDNPRAQSGHSGDEARWESARRHILAAVDRDGDFLDIGCASGYLMESLRRWAAEDGIAVEPYGLDLSPALADLARARLPRWADRIWTGNALSWVPDRRFEYVRTGLEYVPKPRRGDLIAHLLRHVVGRRLILGSVNEVVGRPGWGDEVAGLGYRVAGSVEVPHPDPRVVRRTYWIDAAGVDADG